MEPYPYHYSHRQMLEDSVDPNFRLMLDELQRMELCLGEKIGSRCAGVERRVAEIEQQTEECRIALEMSRTEAETGPAEIQKRVDDVRLEVARLNRFHEHEQMAHSAAQPGIFAAGESAPPPPTQEVAMVLMGTASTYITGVVSLGLNPPMLRSQSRVRPRHHLVLILFLFLIHHVCVNLVRHLI
jgi:hypothetical protein